MQKQKINKQKVMTNVMGMIKIKHQIHTKTDIRFQIFGLKYQLNSRSYCYIWSAFKRKLG